MIGMHDPDEQVVVRLLAELIPEIAAGVVEIKAIARRPGLRTKLAVRSHDRKVDGVGVCVGTPGSRIKRIHDLLGGERMDIMTWHDDPVLLIRLALQPAVIENVLLNLAQHRATVVVKQAQLSLTVGRGGVNRELASRLCGWEIEIVAE